MKDWKTTVSGIATAFFGWVYMEPDLFVSLPVIGAYLVSLAKYLVLTGAVVTTWLTKDSSNKPETR